MKKMTALFSALTLLLPASVFADTFDPYDWDVYSQQVWDHDPIDLSSKEIGSMVETGSWEDLVFYVGTDGFQAVAVYQDEYERKVGLSFHTDMTDIYMTTDYLETPGDYLCAYTQLPAATRANSYVRFYKNEHQIETISLELK